MKLVLALGLLPAWLTGQQDPVARLRAVLPADVADQVIAIVEDATSRHLPSAAIAHRALEAQAKGKSGEAVAAARGLAVDLADSRELLKAAGRTPDDAETEAGAAARSMGVDAKTISALAASEPSGQSLAVPLTVLGSLVGRGLSSDDALAAVRARLAVRAAAPGAGQAGAGGNAGGAASAAGAHGGPPVSVPSNNGTAAGRSRGHQPTQHS